MMIAYYAGSLSTLNFGRILTGTESGAYKIAAFMLASNLTLLSDDA